MEAGWFKLMLPKWPSRRIAERLFSCAPPVAVVQAARAGRLEFRNDYLRLADLEKIKHQRLTWRLMSLELAGVAVSR